MPFGAAVKRGAGWSERISRAGELAHANPAAAEILDAYQNIARFQQGLHKFLQDCSFATVAGGLPELDWPMLLPRFQQFLGIIAQQTGPAPMREQARELEVSGPDRWQQVLDAQWRDEQDEEDAAQLFARAFLQPLAEYLAERGDFPRSEYTGHVCPFCGRKPVVAVLRPEGDGGKRSLICSLCATEWDFLRVQCAGCEENYLEKLPIYKAEEFPSVRIEACDTCKQYIKAIDMTKNGLAVPLVDELATAALNLWAEEKGYRKVQPNLFGL
jgi:FdhE protein